MKYKEIIAQVQTAKNRGVASNSNRLSNRYIISVALRKRSRVIKQERDKKKLKDKFLLQSLCVPLIEVEKHECACVSYNGCKVLRSTFKIPTPIKGTIEQVVSINGSIFFKETSFRDYTKYQRLQTNTPKYYLLNEYLYVSGLPLLTWIKVVGIFEDPLLVETMGACNSQTEEMSCISALETDFRLSPELEDFVVSLTQEEIFNVWRLGVNDIKNNQVDDAQ